MLNRRLGIIYTLIRKKTVTARELAEQYEVSERTIYRDMEALSMSGVPIYAKKGKNGGICLMDGFVLDKLLVTEGEQQQILAALQSLGAVGAVEEQTALRKLGDFFKVEPKNWVEIDYSDWSGRRREMFEQIRQAILDDRVMTFDYYGQKGDKMLRTVEPLQLVFKEYTWYLRAFCRDRQALRLFKVLRMKRVQILEERFVPRPVEEQSASGAETVYELPSGAELAEAVCELSSTTGKTAEDALMTDAASDDRVITVTARIDASEAYRVYDRFEEEELTVLPDGSFLVRITCPLDDWVYGLFFTFGPAAEILEPAEVREEAGRRLRKMCEKYN